MNIRNMDGTDTYKNIAVGAYEKTKVTEAPRISADDRDCAAIMNISSQGYAKSQDERVIAGVTAYEPEQGEYTTVQRDTHAEEERFWQLVDTVKAGDTLNENDYFDLIRLTDYEFKELRERVKEGRTLSEEDAKRLYGELCGRTIFRYHEMVGWSPSNADEKDKMLKEMKNEYLMKQRTLQDMQERIETEKQERRSKDMEAKSAKSAREHADRLSEARMLEKALENLDKGNDAGNQETVKTGKPDHAVSDKPGEEESEDAGSISGMQQDEDVLMHSLHKAIRFEQRDEDNLNKLREWKNASGEKVKIFSDLLDEDFKQTLRTIESEEYSLLEKVNTYETFLDTSKEFAEQREYEKEKKLFDFRTIREAKIASHANHNIRDAWEQTERQLQERSAAVFEEAGQDYITKGTEEKIREIEEQRRYEQQYRAYSETYGKDPDEEDEEQQPG